MRVLVTGGAGFIGANFLRMAVPRFPDHQFLNADALTYAGNLRNLAGIDMRPNYRFVHLDISDKDQVHQAIQSFQPERVFHFAAESHVDRSILGPESFVRTNVLGTFHLLEACRQLWSGEASCLFHHVSTDEVYGSLGISGRFTEKSPYDPSSPYSASKASSDHLVRSYHLTYGLPVKITNCSNNYGPYQFPEKLIPLMILNCLERKPLPIYGDGGQVRDWLYVEDHCEAILSVADRGGLGQTYNIGGGEERTNMEIVLQICTIVAEELGVSAEEFTRLVTFVEDRPGHDRRYAMDTSRIRGELDWIPRESLETGLRKTVRWYLDHEDWVQSVRTGAYRDWIQRNYGERSS